MTTLWLKFPDEILSANSFTKNEQQKLSAIFSSSDPHSPWLHALALLNLKGAQAPMIKWFSGCPYYNWSEMTRLVSGNIIAPVKTKDGGYTFQTRYSMRGIGILLATQWKITRFLTRPSHASGTIAESIALGIALQSLIMRLGGNMEKLATSLAAITTARPQDQKILEQIQAVQLRRTAISSVWNDFLPEQDNEESISGLPDFFWDNDIPSPATTKAETQSSLLDHWKAMAVSGGKITGLAVAVGRNDTVKSLSSLKSKYNAPLILVFRNARPQSAEFFSVADGLLFAEGGVLSHACTVAREMNIPTITALGAAFFAQINSGEKIWLTIDGLVGTVEIIKD